MSNHSEVANFIASISAFIGVCSAFFAFMSYRKSVSHYNLNKRDQFLYRCNQNLDSCYMELNNFVHKFSETIESKEKRIARDKILYLLEIFRSDLNPNEFMSDEFKSSYGNLDVKISDITFENNFEKIINDLGHVKNTISSLKVTLLDKTS